MLQNTRAEALLSKVKKVSQLPSTDNWSDYIDKPLNSWANVAASECVQGEPSIMKALRGLDDGLRRSFLRECQGYLLEFLKVLGSCSYAKSRIARSLSCLSVDMLLGGDAERCGLVPGRCPLPPGIRMSK